LKANFEGKKYHYIDERGNPIDSKDIKVTIDRSIVFKDKAAHKSRYQEHDSSNKRCF